MTELDTGRNTSRPLWLCAGLVALGLHVGGAAFALAHLQNEDSDELLGRTRHRGRAGIDLAAPRSDRPAAGSGLRSRRRLARARRTEGGGQGHRPCPRTRRPRPRIPTGFVTQKQRQEAGGGGRQDRRRADPSLAGIDRGGGHRGPEFREHFQRGRARSRRRRAPARARSACGRPGSAKLMAHLDKHKRYPANALKGAEILVSLRARPDGPCAVEQRGQGIGRSGPSMPPRFSMLKRSDPVPQPPPLVADEGLTFTLPVIFRVKGKG